MSRSGKIEPHLLSSDPVYNSRLVTRLVNYVMKDGKKGPAYTEVYRALEIIKQKTEKEPEAFLESVVNTVAPKMEVRPRRMGGASFQVPTEVRGQRKIALALRWLIEAARKRSSRDYRHFGEKLAQELIDAGNNAGETVKKRDNVQKMAEANRAFAHFSRF